MPNIDVNRYLVPIIIELKTPNDKDSEKGYAKDSILIAAESGKDAKDNLKKYIEKFHIQAVEEFNGEYTPVLVYIKTNMKEYHYIVKIFSKLDHPEILKPSLYMNGKAKFSPGYVRDK